MRLPAEGTRVLALPLVAALLVTFLAASPMPALAADPVCGDVNDSGTVTTADALLVLRDSVGLQARLQCPAPASTPETGQVQCYGTSGVEIGCSGTRQDGDLRSGVPRSFTDNGDGTITDNATGLVWEKLSHDGGIHERDDAYAWGDAFDTKIAMLNAANFAGHDDWRLPNAFELQSLVNFGAFDPATWSAFQDDCGETACDAAACSCTASYTYWSSTSYRDDAKFAWGVGFQDGFTIADDKTSENAVRAVRGGS